jgi:subtilisin family serine protease
MQAPLIGIIDTGVNAWHSHVRGQVDGCRIYAGEDGTICEDSEFGDTLGHGTAVAGVLREALPAARLFAVRVFDNERRTYPSLVARAILSACAAGCDFINLSLALPPGSGAELVRDACNLALGNGVVLVAAGDRQRADLLPASLPGVHGVIADDALGPGEVRMNGSEPYACRAHGKPRPLPGVPTAFNLTGHSLACARVTAYLAGR